MQQLTPLHVVGLLATIALIIGIGMVIDLLAGNRRGGGTDDIIDAL